MRAGWSHDVVWPRGVPLPVHGELPGTSTQEPHITPEEGIKDLWAFFWLAILNSLIIVVAGVATWYYVH